jgi:hypothetical protein
MASSSTTRSWIGRFGEKWSQYGDDKIRVQQICET